MLVKLFPNFTRHHLITHTNIRNSNDIRGIKVDNEEIKVSLFADDLTGFLKGESLSNKPS